MQLAHYKYETGRNQGKALLSNNLFYDNLTTLVTLF